MEYLTTLDLALSEAKCASKLTIAHEVDLLEDALLNLYKRGNHSCYIHLYMVGNQTVMMWMLPRRVMSNCSQETSYAK